MFSKFTTALYDAVDFLAPPITMQDEFISHWKHITSFYTDKSSSCKDPIEITIIPEHLEQMTFILQQEECEFEPNSFGPCLEYFLQNKILKSMGDLATADAPPGMKRYILIFAKNIIGHTKHSLLQHVSIYNSVRKLIKICGESLASPIEYEEINFLDVICRKLEEAPHLIASFFITQPIDETLSQLQIEDKNNVKIEAVSSFPLINSLHILIQSPDCEVRVKAGQNLLLCCSIMNESSAYLIISQTKFCDIIIKKLSSHYFDIPKTLVAADFFDIGVKWGSVAPSGYSDSPISFSIRKLICFIMWYDYFNSLVDNSHNIISNHFLELFKAQFLEKIILLDLIRSIEPASHIFTTSLVTCMLRHTTSLKILDLFSQFLLSSFNKDDKFGEDNNSIKRELVNRCRAAQTDAELAIETLRLFDQLIRKPTVFSLDLLMINKLKTRGYFDTSVTQPNFTETSDDEEGTHSKYDIASKVSYIDKMIDCFLILVPEEIKSCESAESSYDIYIQDAHKYFKNCMEACKDWPWPKAPLELHDDACSSDSQPEVDAHHLFSEGEFLSMLLANLEHILSNPYDLTLLVTSLISRLSLFPHPNLHEFLLNPLLPVKAGVRTLFTTLSCLIADLHAKVKSLPEYRYQLQTVRKYLLSDDDSSLCSSDDPNFALLQAVIVLEEFCKELAAIIFVKHHGVK